MNKFTKYENLMAKATLLYVGNSHSPKMKRLMRRAFRVAAKHYQDMGQSTVADCFRRGVLTIY